jgi:hypothetical protein
MCDLIDYLSDFFKPEILIAASPAPLISGLCHRYICGAIIAMVRSGSLLEQSGFELPRPLIKKRKSQTARWSGLDLNLRDPPSRRSCGGQRHSHYFGASGTGAPLPL